MICKVCKHEWCWICKEDFPVHTPDCPNFQSYLDILEFQGIQANDALHPSGWFLYGRRRGPCFWIFSTLLLLILGLPVIIIVNVLLSPCYALFMIFKCCKIRRRSAKRVLIGVFFGLLLYITAPIIFFIVTIPQVAIFAYKKILELKDLCKNRCRQYRHLRVSPIMNSYFSKLGLS